MVWFLTTVFQLASAVFPLYNGLLLLVLWCNLPVNNGKRTMCDQMPLASLVLCIPFKCSLIIGPDVVVCQVCSKSSNLCLNVIYWGIKWSLVFHVTLAWWFDFHTFFSFTSLWQSCKLLCQLVKSPTELFNPDNPEENLLQLFQWLSPVNLNFEHTP